MTDPPRVVEAAFRREVPLAPFTTFRIGGPARRFVQAGSGDEVRAALDAAQVNGWPLFVLGGGSNLLVSDEGFDGLVLRVAIAGCGPAGSVDARLRFPGSEAVPQIRFVEVGAGENWDGFVDWAIGHGFGGLECLSGIPGTVGGTPVQNVGAYGQEVSNLIQQVRVVDRTTGEVRVLEASECRFRYRASLFNTDERDRHIVLSVIFHLPIGVRANLGYRDLAERFAGRKELPTLLEVREAVLDIRRAKGMVLVEGDPDSRSAGSFFKNPEVSEETFAALAGRMSSPLPRFPAAAGRVKIPAARLIEEAGFTRGYARGGAAISSRHTLALTNRSDATAADVFNLAREIRDRVRERFEVTLIPEPVFVGFREEL